MLENVEYVNPDTFSSSTVTQTTIESPISPSTEARNIAAESSMKKMIPLSSDLETPYWLSDCLEDAKNLIIENHDEKPDDKNFVDCTNFFSQKIFDVKIQNNGNAAGDITLIRGLPSQPSYKIFVHDIFKEDTRNNRRMVTVVLVHQLLHAVHPSRMHDATDRQKGINKLEHDLVNRASYHDALLNLESLTQSGKIHLCNL